jgi:hypothetical protein
MHGAGQEVVGERRRRFEDRRHDEDLAAQETPRSEQARPRVEEADAPRMAAREGDHRFLRRRRSGKERAAGVDVPRDDVVGRHPTHEVAREGPGLGSERGVVRHRGAGKHDPRGTAKWGTPAQRRITVDGDRRRRCILGVTSRRA